MTHKPASDMDEEHVVIDYSKAFDCVEHKLIWEALDRFGIPPHIMSDIKALYENQKGMAHINDQCSKEFPIMQSV